MKKLTKEMVECLQKDLPDVATKPHPSKSYLTSIKPIYVTEKFNKVFGHGQWKARAEIIERVEKMVVIKVIFEVEEYGIYIEQFGGNDNPDLGDAYKGAMTDGLTKIASYLSIGRKIYAS